MIHRTTGSKEPLVSEVQLFPYCCVRWKRGILELHSIAGDTMDNEGNLNTEPISLCSLGLNEMNVK